jgi:hypothetical protein
MMKATGNRFRIVSEVVRSEMFSAEEYGLPVMEVVLARSLALFVIPAVTAFSQDQDLRGNRIWLLIFRGVCGTLVGCGNS